VHTSVMVPQVVVVVVVVSSFGLHQNGARPLAVVRTGAGPQCAPRDGAPAASQLGNLQIVKPPPEQSPPPPALPDWTCLRVVKVLSTV